jgi:serine/threonine-protein kinase
MGAVYRADHVHIKKSFAFKVLHPELTHQKEAVIRFEREAIAAARIDHPNVATAIDFGNLPSGEFYLVLDYVQGQSLRCLLQQEGRLSELRTVRISRQVAAALAAAHAASIVHRDLKPDNVMLVDSSAEADFAKVLDFGIAKLRTEDMANEPAITRFGTVFGTPEYMSPEQALGQSVDARSDLYSLGIMMYEMLSGTTPFADEQLVTVLTRQMTDTPAPLTSVSPELAALIMQLLEKQPDARPASAEQLVVQIDRLALDRLGDTTLEATAKRHVLALGDTDTVFAPISSKQGTLASTEEPVDALTHGNSPPYSLPPWLKQQVVVAGKPLPWVLLAIASALVVATIAMTLTIGSLFSDSPPSPNSSATSSESIALVSRLKENRQLTRWLALASQGDAVALRELENRPESSRIVTEWTAIGAGRAHGKNWLEATKAYEKALSLDAKSATTPQTISNLYQAALLPGSSELALNTAVKYLGASGADLVYAVNEAIIAGRAPKLDRKFVRQLLDSPTLLAQASPSLKIALQLEDQKKSCQGYKALLTEAKNHADSRSLRSLKRLAYDRGCGLLGLRDCFSCLRGTRALSEASEAAKSTAAPTF